MVIMLCMVAIANAQSTPGFVLNGKIEGLKDGSIVYLVIAPKSDTVAKTISKRERFTFTGHVDGDANFFFLKVDTSINKINKSNSKSRSSGSNALWLINDTIKLEGKLMEWDNLRLSKSEPQSTWEAFRSLQEKYKTTPTQEYRFIKKDFIKKNINSLFVPYIINRNALTKEDVLELFTELSDQQKQSYYGVKLTKEVEFLKVQDVMKKTAKPKEEYVPDFKITDLNGKRVSILEIADKADYTLIDFWASWCAPCRAAIPKLKETYNAFHGKGFNIIGVSTDEDAIAWKKAVIKDNTPWNHGLDNVARVSKTVFELVGIPGYILIDRNGKIVQSNVSSSGSFKTIQQIKGKDLNTDLYEIIDLLLKSKK